MLSRNVILHGISTNHIVAVSNMFASLTEQRIKWLTIFAQIDIGSLKDLKLNTKVESNLPSYKCTQMIGMSTKRYIWNANKTNTLGSQCY